jgi:MFS family permease
VAVAFAVLAPLGICLGAFMPLGLGAVAGLTRHGREYVAWGWAVNGFASVVGAVLTTILAMALGFGVVLFLALAVYGIAVAALSLLVRASPRIAVDVEAEVPVPGALTGVATRPNAAPVPGS